jgi:putative transposase
VRLARIRRLDAVTLDYLFLDASFFRMHPGSPAEPVLAARGISTEGKPAFIGLAPGSAESDDAWHDFLADPKDRCLASPVLVIGAGPDRHDRPDLPERSVPALPHPPI